MKPRYVVTWISQYELTSIIYQHDFGRYLKTCHDTIMIWFNTAGKISIEHVNIFLSKYISKGAVDLKFSPDVGNNPNNSYIQRKQTNKFRN